MNRAEIRRYFRKNRRSRRCKGDDYLSGQWDAGGGKG